jgi:cholesterol oxidase
MDDFDVVVIGSGCGGSPAAGNLAEAGAGVCVLERGTWWGAAHGKKAFPTGFLSWFRSFRGVGLSLPLVKKYINLNRREGLFEFYVINGYTVIVPCGVGGGSLIIGGFVDKPPRDIYEHYPREITPEEMEPHFQSVAQVVQPVVAPKPTWYADTIDSACERIDHITPVPQLTSMWYGDGPDRGETRTNAYGCTQGNCRYRGDCLTGCNEGAKNSMDVTYLQLVLKHGGQVRDLAEALAIRQTGSGYEVDYRDLRDGGVRSVSARRVVVSAGAVNTMRLLFRSRSMPDGLPLLSDRLGYKWGFNGDRIGLRMTRHNSLGHSYGPCLFRYMEVESEANDFDYHFFACRSSVMAWPPAPVNRLTDRVMAFLSLSREMPIGRISPAGDVVDVRYPSQECHRAAAIDQKLVAMEADAVARPISEQERRRKVERIQRTRKWKGIGSVHPTGGAAMADSPAQGVVDHRGEVFNYPGLYVSDSSIFPVAPCCGPHFFIMAHADRISRLMIESER